MTKTNFSRAWVLTLLIPCACVLPPDLLEAGSLGGDGSSDGEDTGDGTSDTGGSELAGPECVVQGTNFLGEPEPHHFQLETCQVICAEGWGHDVPLLESEWTEEPAELFGLHPTRGSLAVAPEGNLVLVLSSPDDHYQFHTLSPDGEYLWDGYTSGIEGEILDFGIDADEPYYYFLWTDGITQRLAVGPQYDGISFEIELGPHQYGSTLAVTEDGVLVALRGEGTRLLRIDQNGTILIDQPIPETSRIDVSPSGDVIALASPTMLGWADMQGNYLGGYEIGDVTSLLGLVAVDDTHVVFAGGEPDSGGDPRGFLRAFDAMGSNWAHSYDRAEVWCAEYDANKTEEIFTGLEQLADGTLIVIGVEGTGNGGGYPNDDTGVDGHRQPWVAHVSAEGELVAYDRGFWYGSAIDVATRDNIAYVLLTDENYGSGPYMRKYTF